MDFRNFKSEDWTKWITAFVGVTTALVAVTNFAYKELIAPSAVPINISLDLQVEPREIVRVPPNTTTEAPNGRDGEFIPVVLTVKATNDSNKTLAMAKPFWIIYGIHKKQASFTSNSFLAPKEFITETFNKFLGNPLQSDIPRMEVPQDSYRNNKDNETLLNENPRKLIAAGELFAQREIRSREAIQVQRTVFVDKWDNYTYLEARVYIPTLAKRAPGQQPNRILFYSFANPLGYSLDKELNTFFLINAWCVEPMRMQLRESMDRYGMLTLLKPSVFLESRRRNTAFCRIDPKFQSSPMSLGSLLDPDQEAQAGAQFFTTSYEVLLRPKTPPSPESK
jgi:hypothetical protein